MRVDIILYSVSANATFSINGSKDERPFRARLMSIPAKKTYVNIHRLGYVLCHAF